MNYDVLYSNNNKQFKNSTRQGKIFNMGNWRSRWERKRDLDRANGFYINRIYTKPTNKDYIFTKAYGYDAKSNMYFKIVPAISQPKLKNNWVNNPAKRCNDPNSSKFGKYCRYK